MRPTYFVPATLAVAACLFAPTARAQDLITDGGFERATAGLHQPGTSPPSTSLGDGDSDSAGWVSGGPLEVVDFSRSAHGGDQFAGLAGICEISQAVAAQAGQSYVLTFYAAATNNLSFTVLLGNRLFAGSPAYLPSYSPDSPSPYTKYTLGVVSPYDDPLLRFFSDSGPRGGVRLDDVSLVAAPEPSQDAALGVGVLILTGLALRARRRRAASYRIRLKAR